MTQRDHVGGPLGGLDAGDPATESTSPFLTSRLAIAAVVSGFMKTLQRATARRCVGSFGVTSTMRARPSGSRWVKDKSLKNPHVSRRVRSGGCPALPYDALHHLRTDAVRFLEVVTTRLEHAVPSCPGWDLGDLAWHLGGVWNRFARIVSEPITTRGVKALPLAGARMRTRWSSTG